MNADARGLLSHAGNRSGACPGSREPSSGRSSGVSPQDLKKSPWDAEADRVTCRRRLSAEFVGSLPILAGLGACCLLLPLAARAPIAAATATCSPRGFGAATQRLRIGCSPARSARRRRAVRRLFSRGSPWNRRLPRHARLDPSSHRRVAALVDDLEAKMSRGYYPTINADKWSTPLYVVRRHQPRIRVHLDNTSPVLAAALARVPIPRGAAPAVGSDAHLTVHQPSTDSLWELWHASKRPDGWHAVWGGAIRGVPPDPGSYTYGVCPGLLPTKAWGWASTAPTPPVMPVTILHAEPRRGGGEEALPVGRPPW